MTTIDSLPQDAWTRQDARLPDDWPTLTPDWHRDHALRTDHGRRQALVEIDILVAKALGLTLDELQAIYRIQFRFMRRHEAETYYDTTGRITSTLPKGLPAICLPGKAIKGDTSYSLTTPGGVKQGIRFRWEDIRRLKSATIARTLGQAAPPEDEIMYLASFGCSDRKEGNQIARHSSTVGN